MILLRVNFFIFKVTLAHQSVGLGRDERQDMYLCYKDPTLQQQQLSSVAENFHHFRGTSSHRSVSCSGMQNRRNNSSRLAYTRGARGASTNNDPGSPQSVSRGWWLDHNKVRGRTRAGAELLQASSCHRESGRSGQRPDSSQPRAHWT